MNKVVTCQSPDGEVSPAAPIVQRPAAQLPLLTAAEERGERAHLRAGAKVLCLDRPSPKGKPRVRLANPVRGRVIVQGVLAQSDGLLCKVMTADGSRCPLG